MKRARRRPYVSLIPRKPGSAYLLWNLGVALASSPSTVEIHVGYFDDDSSKRFILLKRIGPPQVSGGTFVHINQELGDRCLIAMIVQKTAIPDSPHCIVPGDVYATSRPIRLVRARPCFNPPQFVVLTYQYPLPLRIDALSEELYGPISKLKLSQVLLDKLQSTYAGSSHSSHFRS